MLRFLRPIRILLLALLVIAVPPAVYAGYLGLTGNVHTVAAGMLYRAGQMDADDLAALIQRHHIRTVINLRGAHPDDTWYRQEAAAVSESGARYVPIAISSRKEPDAAQMAQIVNALQQSPQPILVHCQGGADRTGLVSALFQLVVSGTSKQQAEEQLGIAYGHIPALFVQTKAMDRAFASFAAYWATGAGRAVAGLD